MDATQEWTADRPRTSGVYWFFDHLDTIAEEITVMEIDLDSGTVYRLGLPPAPFNKFDGLWCGPFGPLTRR